MEGVGFWFLGCWVWGGWGGRGPGTRGGGGGGGVVGFWALGHQSYWLIAKELGGRWGLGFPYYPHRYSLTRRFRDIYLNDGRDLQLRA